MPQSGIGSSAPALTLLTSLSLILVGCVLNNVVLEAIVSTRANPHADPGAGGLLTFLQFSFVAACNVGEAVTWRKAGVGGSWLPFALRTPVVPVRHYAQMTLLFFAMSYLNNFVFQFNISQPLHMVFRSANLATTVVLGAIFFSRRYSVAQLICVLLLTLGALSATLAEAFSGDTAKAASAADGGCANCVAGAAVPGTGALLREAAANASAVAAAAGAAAAASSWYMIVWSLGVAMLAAVLVLQT